MSEEVPQLPPNQYRFATTCWTQVLEVAKGGSPEQFAALCQQYWYPLYAFLRRSGKSAQDAEDTIQAFFAWVMESNVLERVDPEKGRFRSFLLVLLRQFQAREHQYQSAAKRSPTGRILSFDQDDGESRYQMHVFHNETAEALFEQAWVISLIENTLTALREEMAAAGKGEQFECLRGMLTGQRDISGREAAEKLGMSEGAIRIALHRMRKRFGELMRAQVALTVQHAEDVEAELRELIAKLKV